jgi:predicted DNA-binding transcriptional regulator AlpA
MLREAMAAWSHPRDVRQPADMSAFVQKDSSLTRRDPSRVISTTREGGKSRNIIRKPAVTHRTGLSYSTIWRLEETGDFPARIQITERAPSAGSKTK